MSCSCGSSHMKDKTVISKKKGTLEKFEECSSCGRVGFIERFRINPKTNRFKLVSQGYLGAERRVA